jgi:hypothetical protein
MSVKPAYIYAGVAIFLIVGLSIALIVVAASSSSSAAALKAIPHNKRMADKHMQDAIAHHRRLNMHQHQPVIRPILKQQQPVMHQHVAPRQPVIKPVRLNTAPIHSKPEEIPPVREQHNFNVRFGQSREPLRNMMASDNEGAHLSSAIWNRESLIRQHKVIS